MVRLTLPTDYRVEDFLRFHGRDRLAFAEVVSARRLRKGLFWRGRSIAIQFDFSASGVEVEGGMECSALTALAEQMLGLAQPVEAFSQAVQGTVLSTVVQAQAGLRIPLTATPFEALTWAITSQQISVSAAITMRRKLIQTAGACLPEGLWCYPDAARLATVSEDIFKALGFSRSKARTLGEVSQAVASGTLVLQANTASEFQDLARRLLAIPGIGLWTVNYALMRGLGYLDGSLDGDAGVRRGIQALLARPEPVSAAFARRWLEPFSPWRGLAAAHLWAFIG